MDEMDAVIKEFIAESRENLEQLDRDLVELEKRPGAREQLASIFRTIHSIKGATGFLGFSKLGALAHAGESLLSKLRDGALMMDRDITSGLLALVDYIRQDLSSIEQFGVEDEADCSALVANLERLQETRQTRRPETRPLGGRGEDPHSAGLGDNALGAQARSAQTTLRASAWSQDSAAFPDAKGFDHEPFSTRVRVNVKRLDKLMNLVGELVLTRNELLQAHVGQQNAVSAGISQRLNAITAELQEEVMKVRIQPIGNVWNKFPRLVRDLALLAGKNVCLEMKGEDTELDKTLIEAITDPLTHLVRNAVDHGLEVPAERTAAGKPIEGHLSLRAAHEAGQVKIEISDDGAGVDLGGVKREALKKGLVTADQLRGMRDTDAVNLIFLPGFSTARKVTSISGRGVGMDVVKTNIEKIGGTVGVESQPGLGTTVKIKIPLTLAIMSALVVAAGGEQYAIPQANVLELVRMEGSEARSAVERIQDAAVYRLRGELLPLIRLDAALELGTDRTSSMQAPEDEAVNIIVLEADDRKFGLVVDQVNDTQEIVVKPLGKHLRGIPTFGGATILGDGKVVLILDVIGLAAHTHAIPESRVESLATLKPSDHGPTLERQTLLLFVGSDDNRMAIPLSQIARLEEFSSSSLEHTGDLDVVQYRGGLLPLVNVSTLLEERRSRQRRLLPDTVEKRTVRAIVYRKEGYQVGLVVDDIVDAVEFEQAGLLPASRKGPCATAVIRGRATEILDLEALCSGDLLAAFQQLPVAESKA
jgi:two-component system chemotaxis sensor kinase CheA